MIKTFLEIHKIIKRIAIRYWYENNRERGRFTDDQLEQIRKTSLARLFKSLLKIICYNSRAWLL